MFFEKYSRGHELNSFIKKYIKKSNEHRNNLFMFPEKNKM